MESSKKSFLEIYIISWSMQILQESLIFQISCLNMHLKNMRGLKKDWQSKSLTSWFTFFLKSIIRLSLLQFYNEMRKYFSAVLHYCQPVSSIDQRFRLKQTQEDNRLRKLIQNLKVLKKPPIVYLGNHCNFKG